jgi:hypothetical protein
MPDRRIEWMTPERSRCLESLARLILRVERPHPVRVAVDGPDAAGKTILADGAGAAHRAVRTNRHQGVDRRLPPASGAAFRAGRRVA